MRRHLSLLLALVVAGCASAPPATGDGSSIGLAAARVPRKAPSGVAARSAGESIDAFGFDLFRAVVGGTGGGNPGNGRTPPATNAVISPASVAIALSMARAGAAGDTAAQMDAVLHVTTPDWAAAVNSLDQALGSRSGSFRDVEGHDMTVALRIANAPFAQGGVRWNEPYLDRLAASFGAGLRLVDYRQAPESARKLINGWVSDQTEHRITELLAPGVIDTATRLTLVNAIYLKAPWAMPFWPEATRPEPFHRTDGTDVKAPTMALTHEFGYAAGDGWRAVELPYVGGSLAMDIVVPDDLAAFSAHVTGARFGAIVGSLQVQPVTLHLPRFSIRTQADLDDALDRLGMPLAFDRSNADFSPMTADERLFISAVAHQATIDVDEKGTEATAATAVAMAAAGVPQTVDVRVDRPFLIALRDIPTGLILFVGQVVDPTAGS